MSTPLKSPATGGNRREAQVSSLHNDYTANETLTAANRAMRLTGVGIPNTLRADDNRATAGNLGRPVGTAAANTINARLAPSEAANDGSGAALSFRAANRRGVAV